ncbi:MAG: hypothetical protein ACLVJB_02650 [Christensenellales bacterium]
MMVVDGMFVLDMPDSACWNWKTAFAENFAQLYPEYNALADRAAFSRAA